MSWTPRLLTVHSVGSPFLLCVFPAWKPVSPDPEGKNTGWNKGTDHGNLIAVGPFQSRGAFEFCGGSQQAGFWAGEDSPLGLGTIMFKELEKFSPGTVSGLSSLGQSWGQGADVDLLRPQTLMSAGSFWLRPSLEGPETGLALGWKI